MAEETIAFVERLLTEVITSSKDATTALDENTAISKEAVAVARRTEDILERIAKAEEGALELAKATAEAEGKAEEKEGDRRHAARMSAAKWAAGLSAGPLGALGMWIVQRIMES